LDLHARSATDVRLSSNGLDNRPKKKPVRAAPDRFSHVDRARLSLNDRTLLSPENRTSDRDR
jgi:hypothetical protein